MCYIFTIHTDLYSFQSILIYFFFVLAIVVTMSSTQPVYTVTRENDRDAQDSKSTHQTSVIAYDNNNRQVQTTWIGDLYNLADELIGKSTMIAGIVYYRNEILNGIENTRLVIKNNMYEFAMDLITIGADLPNVKVHVPLTALYWISKMFNMQLNPTVQKLLTDLKSKSRRFSYCIVPVTEQFFLASSEFTSLGKLYEQYSLENLYESLINNTDKKNVKELLQDIGEIKRKFVASFNSNSTDPGKSLAIYDHVVQMESLAQCSTFDDFNNMFNATMHYSISSTDATLSLEKDAFILLSQLCCSKYSNSDISRKSCDLLLQLILKDNQYGQSFLNFSAYTIGGKKISHEISTKIMNSDQIEFKAEDLLKQFTSLVEQVESNRTWTAEAIRIATTFTPATLKESLPDEVDEETEEIITNESEILQTYDNEVMNIADDMTGLAIEGAEDTIDSNLNDMIINIPHPTQLEITLPTRGEEFVSNSTVPDNQCIDMTDFANNFMDMCHINEHIEQLTVTTTTIHHKDDSRSINNFMMQHTNNIYPNVTALFNIGNMEDKPLINKELKKTISKLTKVFNMKNIDQTNEHTLVSSVLNEVLSLTVAWNRTLNNHKIAGRRNAALLRKYRINTTNIMNTLNSLNQTNQFLASNITASELLIQDKQKEIEEVRAYYQREIRNIEASHHGDRLAHMRNQERSDLWLKIFGWIILAMATVIIFGLGWYFKCRKSKVQASYIDPANSKLIEVTDNSLQTDPLIRPENHEEMTRANRNEFEMKHDITSFISQENTYKRSNTLMNILKKHTNMSELDVNKLNAFSKVYKNSLELKDTKKQHETHRDHVGGSSFLPYNLPRGSDNISHFSTIDRLKMQLMSSV